MLTINSSWLVMYEGSSSVIPFITSVVMKTFSADLWNTRAKQGKLLATALDLREIFKPVTFLNAFRQHISRQSIA